MDMNLEAASICNVVKSTGAEVFKHFMRSPNHDLLQTIMGDTKVERRRTQKHGRKSTWVAGHYCRWIGILLAVELFCSIHRTERVLPAATIVGSSIIINNSINMLRLKDHPYNKRGRININALEIYYPFNIIAFVLYASTGVRIKSY